MIDEYINKNYKRLKRVLRPIAKGCDEQTYEDLFHQCLMIFIEHKKAKDSIRNNQAQFFIARIMMNQWRSNNSEFKRYDKKHTYIEEDYFQDDTDYDHDKDIVIEAILNALDEMMKQGGTSEYRAHIIIYYFTSNQNYNEVSRKYNIKATNARYSFIEGMKELKTIINNDDIFRIHNAWNYVGDTDFIETISKSDRLFRKETH